MCPSPLRFAVAVSLGAVLGCVASPPDLPGKPDGGRVTLFIPGIQGSFLVTAEGDRAWVGVGDALTTGEETLALDFPGTRTPASFGPLQPDGVTTRFSFPPFKSVDIYLSWLEHGRDRLAGFQAFAYDWRRDNRETVRALAARIDALVAAHPGLAVDLVGHSMGGLIALTYLRYGSGDPAAGVTWAGAKHVRRLVLAGCPFRGCASVLGDLHEGDLVGRNRHLLAKEALFTFASTHQLLPFPGTFFVDEANQPLATDFDDAAAWIAGGWGVFADEANRRDPAYRAQLERVLEAHRAFGQGLRDLPGDAPPDVRALVVSGIGRPTMDAIRLVGGRLDFFGSPWRTGDGRVTDVSAMPPRPLAYEVVTTDADHVALLNDPKVQERIDAFLGR